MSVRNAARASSVHLDERTTASLRAAVECMSNLVKEARQSVEETGFFDSDWYERARTAMNRVVRESIEIRAVALLSPDVWPFNRT